MLANYLAALCLYIRNTWMRPPPLTSEAAQHAANAAKPNTQGIRMLSMNRLPRSKQSAESLKAAASGNNPKFQSALRHATGQNVSVVDASTAKAAKNTQSRDQDAAASAGHGPVAGRKQEEQQTLTLHQKTVGAMRGVCGKVQAVARKVKGEVWEDDNFRCEDICHNSADLQHWGSQCGPLL